MATTKEAVAKLYVAFFNRAPDAAGLEYWVNKVEKDGWSLEQISQSFFDQDETKEKYPDTLTTAQFINAIYNNLFGRDADDEGLVYWAKEIDSGNIPRSEMIIAVVNGAQDTSLGKDKTILENKAEVALDFADSGLNDLEKAKSIMENITADPSTVESAKTQIQIWDDALHSFSLTNEKDTIKGTDAKDTITGTFDNFQAGDTIDGKDGYDTLKLTGINGTTGQATVKNVEKLVLGVTGESHINFADFDKSIKDVEITAGANITLGSDGNATTTKDKIDNILETLKINLGVADKTVTLDYDSSVVSGNNDTQSFIVDTNNKLTLEANGIENFKATINKTESNLEIKSNTIKDVKIDGAGGLKTLKLNTLIDSVDLSGLKGKFGTDVANPVATMDINAKNITTGDGSNFIDVNTKNTQTLKTGDGDDTIKLTDSKLKTLDVDNGNNTIMVSSVATTINAGKGDDKTTVDNANAKIDTLYLGNGNNELKYTADGTVSKIYSGSGTDDITIAKGTTEVKTGDGGDTIRLKAADAIDSNPTIDGGDGSDTLDAKENDIDADLDLSSATIKSIETILLKDDYANKLTIKPIDGLSKITGFKDGGKLVLKGSQAWAKVANANEVDQAGEFHLCEDNEQKEKLTYFDSAIGEVQTITLEINSDADTPDTVEYENNDIFITIA